MTAQSVVSPLILRSRKSEYPAIGMSQAVSIVERAFEQALPSLQTIQKSVKVETIQLGDVLAEEILAKSPHPPFRASIKDGYAVLASDGAGPRRVVGTSTADKNGTGTIALKLSSGVCCRINTGAALPSGADAVVQVEDTTLLEHDNVEETTISIAKEPRIGQDISKAAVAVLSTGDELTDQLVGYTDTGYSTAIRDTNRPMLLSLFKSIGAQVHDIGIAPDNKEKIVAAFKKAFELSNILVVTGGVSMGEKDLLKPILTQVFGFQIHFGRVFMKPGLPTTFASGVFEGGAKFVFGLPGNPVSSFVTAHLFVCPVLKLVGGVKVYKSSRIRVKTIENIKLDPRPEYRRACLVQKTADTPEVECLSGSQISSRLLSLRTANMLLELPGATPAKQMVYKGEVVEALVIAPI